MSITNPAAAGESAAATTETPTEPAATEPVVTPTADVTKDAASDKPTELQIGDLVYRPAPSNEARVLQLDRLSAKQRRLKFHKDKVDGQLRDATHPSSELTDQEIDALFERSEQLSGEGLKVGFELAAAQLVDADGNPPPQDQIDIEAVSKFLGWEDGPTIEEQADPSPATR